MKQIFSFKLPIPPYLRDHCVEGQAVFPAVESLALLAREVQNRRPGALVNRLADADFPKMLALPEEADELPVRIEIEERENGIHASLQTTVSAKTASIRRALVHARVTFVRKDAPPEAPMPFQASGTTGDDSIPVAADSVYRKWIPFGPSYRNLVGTLAVSREGVSAEISGGSGEADDTPLGSPFAPDAAMQAACVWGQRFAGIAAFPTGFDHRIIYRPVKNGETCFARVIPVTGNRGVLVFDVWIFDRREMLCESIRGLRMSDIFRGRLKTPRRIGEGE
jgi:hypothetical protein